MQTVALGALTRTDDPGSIADRLLALPNSEDKTRLLGLFSMSWAARAPAAAVQWMLANGASLGDETFARIAMQVAGQTPDAAAGYTAQVPPGMRAEWISAVAQGYARNDPNAALRWLGQFRGQPEYGRAVVGAAPMLAASDPAAAGRLFAEAAPQDPQAPVAASIIASHWAQQDPESAAPWARGLTSPSARDAALQAMLQQWAAQDKSAATAWVHTLPPGAERDTLLDRMLVAAARTGTVPPELVNAFSTAAARSRSLLAAVVLLAHADPTRTRAVADRYLTDPGQHAQAERMLESAANPPAPGSATFNAVGTPMDFPTPASRRAR